MGEVLVVAWEKASQVGVGRSIEAQGGGHAVSTLGGNVALCLFLQVWVYLGWGMGEQNGP